jgi:hypothetical protein
MSGDGVSVISVTCVTPDAGDGEAVCDGSHVGISSAAATSSRYAQGDLV